MGVIGLKKELPEDRWQSPLDNWSTDIDPAIMAGDHWSTSERDAALKKEGKRDFRERPKAFGAMFMHPTHDVSYDQD